MRATTLKVLIAISLLSLSTFASADRRSQDSCSLRANPSQIGCWQQGFANRILRWDGARWRRAPGSANEVGNGWVLGTDRGNGGYRIYRWTGNGWRRAPGAAVRIGGPYDRPWVVNDENEHFVWTGHSWRRTARAYRLEPRDSWHHRDRHGERRDHDDLERSHRPKQRRNHW
ncbi:MAG: hypothetical protein R3332_06150 [Pseudohongiellaceae bacterium]|nr:hypothetical protein [Pseudohongiellaceae bacterium]